MDASELLRHLDADFGHHVGKGSQMPLLDSEQSTSCSPQSPQSESASPLTENLELFDVARLDRDSRRMVTVFRQEDLNGLSSTRAGSSEDHVKRMRTLSLQLRSRGGDRPLADPPEGWQARVAELCRLFPNFGRVIEEAIAPSFAVAAAGGYLRPAPLLLVGPPGCGKSFFAQTIADLLNVPVVRQDMSSATMSCTLSGLAVHWGNSAPGEVFKTLALGRAGKDASASPVFVLDEVDKVQSDMQYNPISPLYALLEVESAKQFEDESIPGLPMDASHIRWLLTANDASKIPEPIRSRVLAFDIAMPAPQELRLTYARLFARLVQSSGVPNFSLALPLQMVQGDLPCAGPREFKVRCTVAIGRALMDGRRRVEARDFVAEQKTSVTFGFIAR